jgi:hypothetical protein
MPPVLLPPRLTGLEADDPDPVELEALIREARARQRRRRIAAAVSAGLVLILAASLYTAFGRGGASTRGAFGGGRLCVVPPSGWRTAVARLPLAPPTLVLTNFGFGRMNYLFGHTDPRLRWPRGGILISVSDWTRSSTASMRSNYAASAIPLSVARGDFAPFEGVRDLGQRSVSAGGRLLEVWVQARPTTAATILEANNALAGIRGCSS